MEPASTRKRYRKRGFGKTMLTAVWIRCRENVVNCTYVELYCDWREKLYGSAWFRTYEKMGIWVKAEEDNI